MPPAVCGLTTVDPGPKVQLICWAEGLAFTVFRPAGPFPAGCASAWLTVDCGGMGSTLTLFSEGPVAMVCGRAQRIVRRLHLPLAPPDDMAVHPLDRFVDRMLLPAFIHRLPAAQGVAVVADHDDAAGRQARIQRLERTLRRVVPVAVPPQPPSALE